MSAAHIRAALQSALAAMSPPMATAWEDFPSPEVDAAKGAGDPYQAVALLFARPINGENSSSYTEHGFLQITLAHLKDQGPEPAEARLALLRQAFRRQASFTHGGVVTTIDGTPAPMAPYIEGDRRRLPVRIPFFANITA